MAIQLAKVWLRDREWPNDDCSGSRWGDKKISRITIHCAAGRWPTIKSAYNCISNPGYKATWTYAVADNGEIGQFLSEERRPGTSSNRYNDNRAITMEVSCDPSAPYEITDEAFKSVINLCEDICVRHNICGLYYTGDIRTSNLTLHKWFTNKACPGGDIISKLPYIAATVNTRLKQLHGMTLVAYTDPVSDAEYSNSNYRPSVAHGSVDWEDVWDGDLAFNYAVYGFTSLPKEYLSQENLYPYIVTIDRNSNLSDDLDQLQTALRAQKVCGGVIEAGYVYDSMYIKREFKSPRFYEQIQAFDAMDIPYGLWMTCRARTEAEAKAEMLELRRCVQLSKLNLGVWLDLQFPSTRTAEQNDIIINIYKKLLEDMGLTGKIGFYVTPQQLKTITWIDHQNDWLLWLVDRLSSNEDLTVLDNLLIPDFWNVDRAFDLEDQTLDTEQVSITFGKAYPFPTFEEKTVEV